MSRQDANAAFAQTSFLYGGNAAYIEDLYRRYKTDPKSIDPTWAGYFGRLEDSSDDVRKNAEGPSWARADWPEAANGELVSALDGNWEDILVKTSAVLGKKAAAEGAPAPTPVDVLQSTRDSIRAIMMIRAYRSRGHLHADVSRRSVVSGSTGWHHVCRRQRGGGSHRQRIKRRSRRASRRRRRPAHGFIPARVDGNAALHDGLSGLRPGHQGQQRHARVRRHRRLGERAHDDDALLSRHDGRRVVERE